jgi:peptidoglycan/LPS O-acetylase OafA/YrhL
MKKIARKKSSGSVFSSVIKQPSDYYIEIDYLKGFAIISVILLHTVIPEIWLLLGAPYHIWQAVPLFMLIAGFTGAYAYQRHKSSTPVQCFNRTLLIRRFKRILMPYALYWIIQVIVLVFIFHQSFDLISLTVNFIKGGSSWGAYFVPAILQSILIIPLLYLLALRNPDLMVILALAVNILFELILLYYGIQYEFIELLYFRYLFAGALGVWLVTKNKRPLGWLIVGGFIGFVFLTLVCYTPILSSFNEFSGYAGVFHAPAYLWTLVLAVGGLHYLPKTTMTKFYCYLEKTGKASWHIFLAQMFYFILPGNIIINNFLLPLATSIPAPINVLVAILAAIIHVTLCVLIGYGWYLLELFWFSKSPVKGHSL